MTLEEQLRALIDSAPPRIQRHFACDCVERVLRPANVKDERYWRAIEIARRYTEGEATYEDLAAAGAAAWWDTAGLVAWDAAGLAARLAASDEERAWQIAHIQHLLATHNAARSSLLSILQQRAEMIQKILPQNAQTLEEALFT